MHNIGVFGHNPGKSKYSPRSYGGMLVRGYAFSAKSSYVTVGSKHGTSKHG